MNQFKGESLTKINTSPLSNESESTTEKLIKSKEIGANSRPKSLDQSLLNRKETNLNHQRPTSLAINKYHTEDIHKSKISSSHEYYNTPLKIQPRRAQSSSIESTTENSIKKLTEFNNDKKCEDLQKELKVKNTLLSEIKTPVVDDDDDDEKNLLFDPSIIFVSCYRCWYKNHKSCVRKGKLFISKNEMLFKCSGMPFVKAYLTYDKIKSVKLIKKKPNFFESIKKKYIEIESFDNLTYTFYRFVFPTTYIFKKIEKMHKKYHEKHVNQTSNYNKETLTQQTFNEPLLNTENPSKINKTSQIKTKKTSLDQSDLGSFNLQTLKTPANKSPTNINIKQSPNEKFTSSLNTEGNSIIENNAEAKNKTQTIKTITETKSDSITDTTSFLDFKTKLIISLIITLICVLYFHINIYNNKIKNDL